MEQKSAETQKDSSNPSPVLSAETGQLKTLDIDTVRELWSKTYNMQGKPDWSHIYPYYHPDVVFQDSIQRIEGITEFVALCERLTNRCEKLQMEIHAMAQNANVIFMSWTMTMVFKKSPSTPIYGTTRLVLHPDGRIIEQRDYYDLWGDIFNNIPYFKGPYRKFMRRYFG
jgi:limonene-1,2-epoxide hydrolase